MQKGLTRKLVGKHRFVRLVTYSVCVRVLWYVKEINLLDEFASPGKQWNQYQQMCCIHLRPTHSTLCKNRINTQNRSIFEKKDISAYDRDHSAK